MFAISKTHKNYKFAAVIALADGLAAGSATNSTEIDMQFELKN
jgi:hypothetical protein